MAKDNQGGPGPRTSPASPGDEGFLGRWSRRKTEAKLPAALPTADADLPEENHEQPAIDTDLSAADTEPNNQLSVADLPDIDKLNAGSDFSVFMQAGVPPALKTKALRKLWRVKPELANLDGLLDYGEDLTGSFKVVEHLKTAYRVGRGFVKDEEEKPEAAVADAEQTDDDGQVSGEPPRAKDKIEPGNIDQLTIDDAHGEGPDQEKMPKKITPKTDI